MYTCSQGWAKWNDLPVTRSNRPNRMLITSRGVLIIDVPSVPPVSAPLPRSGDYYVEHVAEHVCGMYWAHAGVLKASPPGMVMAQGASDADETRFKTLPPP